MKIIHVGLDSQFLQFIGEVFEELAPNSNQYLVTGASVAGDFRYMNYGDRKTISIQGKRGLVSIPLYVRSCDMIIAHGMGPHAAFAFAVSPPKAIRVWSGWGYDYYGHDNDSSAGLLKPETAALVQNYKVNKRDSLWLKNSMLKLGLISAESAARRTDYFSAPIPSDYKVFKQRFPGFNGNYIQLNYGDVSQTFSRGLKIGRDNNILLGNSSSATNNHIEMLDILSRHNLGRRKVIVPLSYGNAEYRASVIDAGKKLLGDSFVPLVEYMSLNEYSSVVASCNVVIMNHLRQQALGNIGTALYHGAHVYLDPLSPVYRFFVDNGAVINSTEKLSSNNLPVNKLSNDLILRNRAVLDNFWGAEQIRTNVRTLLAKVNAE